jgi:hypothetical protein
MSGVARISKVLNGMYIMHSMIIIHGKEESFAFSELPTTI